MFRPGMNIRLNRSAAPNTDPATSQLSVPFNENCECSMTPLWKGRELTVGYIDYLIEENSRIVDSAGEKSKLPIYKFNIT